VQASLEAGVGPTTSGALVAALAERLVERMGPVLAELDEQLDAIEVEALEGAGECLRPRLADLRRRRSHCGGTSHRSATRSAG
jgi:zinc transporter